MRKGTGLRRELWLALIYLGVAVTSALLWARVMRYETMVLPPGAPSSLESWHREIISGQAPAPNQYRLLVPWAAELIRRVIPGWLADLACPPIPSQSLIAAYFAIRVVSLWLTLLAMDRYLREWFVPAAAAGGALLLGALVPFSYYCVVQESDLPNLLVIVVSFLALTRGKDLWLVPLVLVGTLNRETTALLPALYLLARWKDRPTATVVTRTALLAGCWAAVYGGLLIWFGKRGAYTDMYKLPTNLSSWIPTANAFLLFGVVWVLAALALRRDPPLILRRAVWLAPPFVVVQYLVGVVNEVRLFLPLAPILIPLSWWLLFPEARQHAAMPASRRARR